MHKPRTGGGWGVFPLWGRASGARGNDLADHVLKGATPSLSPLRMGAEPLCEPLGLSRAVRLGGGHFTPRASRVLYRPETGKEEPLIRGRG